MGEPRFHQGSLTVPNGGLLRITWDMPNLVIAVNVIGLIVAAAGLIDQSKANAVGAAIKSGFTSSGLAGKVTNQGALQNVGIRDIRTPNQVEYIDTGAAVAGTATGDALPGGNAVVVSMRTALAGPSYRGRTYLSGFTEADNTASSAINSSLGTACVAFMTAVQSALAGQGLTLAVISRPHLAWDATYVIHHNDGTDETQQYHHRGRPGQANAVTSIVLRNAIWDSQRRRTAAGGGSTLSAPLVNVNLMDGTRTGKWAS